MEPPGDAPQADRLEEGVGVGGEAEGVEAARAGAMVEAAEGAEGAEGGAEGAAGGVGGGAGGDAEAARYALARCASQSSLDESSQRPAPAPPPPPPAAAHAARLLEALARLRRGATLCDVRLRAQAEPGDAPGGGPDTPPASAPDEGIWAHRAVLAACSPYFRAMFTQFEERSQPSVTIRGVEPAALAAIVHYMYEPDALAVTEGSVQALLAAASLLQVSGVRAAAAGFLAAALAPDNALGIRAFADLHACADLARHAATYIDAHFAEVLEGEEFLALAPDALARLLDSDRIVVPSEEVVLDAVIRWMEHDPESRRAQLGGVLEHVRLPLVGQEALAARAQREPLLGAGLRVKDLLIEALSLHVLRGARRVAAAAACPRARPRAPARAPQALLVVGGQAPKAIRDVEAYELERGRWRGAADLPTRRCRAGLAHLDDKVYAVGGFNGTLRVRSVDVYSVSRDAWAAGPALGARRSTLGVAVLGTRIYAVGGFDGATGLSSAEVLETREPGAGWRPIAAMSTRRSSVGVAVLGGRVYAVGGYDGASRQCLHTVERYDPLTDSWEAVAEMGARRSGAGVGVLEGALYAVGGHDGPAVRRSVERYREGEGWAAAPPMSHARRNAGVTAHQGKLYVVGGDDGAANLASVEVFDPATEQWTLLPAAMGTGRSYAGVCVVQRPAPAPASYANVNYYNGVGVGMGTGVGVGTGVALAAAARVRLQAVPADEQWWWHVARAQPCRHPVPLPVPVPVSLGPLGTLGPLPLGPLALRDHCTMPRVTRRVWREGGCGGAGGAGAGAAGAGAARWDALSASCGSIDRAELAPCVLVLRAPPAPSSAPEPLAAPRASCSYHVLPESQRAPRRPAPAPAEPRAEPHTDSDTEDDSPR